MKPLASVVSFFVLLILVSLGSVVRGGTKAPDSGELLNLKDPGLLAAVKGNDAVVSMNEGGAPGVKLAVAAGSSTPGADFPCPAGGWDLSAFGGVKAEITNTSTIPLKVNLRIDNEGDWQKNPWNAEFEIIPPGGSSQVNVRFGHSYRGPGYNLDPHSVIRLFIFVESPTQAGSIVVKSIQAVK